MTPILSSNGVSGKPGEVHQLLSARSWHDRYTPQLRAAVAMQHRDTLRDVALKRPEAGHRKVREYAVPWQQLTRGEPGTNRMSCYRVLKADGLNQPGRYASERDPGSAAELRQLHIEPNAVIESDVTTVSKNRTSATGC